MRKIDKIEFCNRGSIKHNSKYDYSLVEYKNNRTNVKIICKIHGEFEQSPDVHLRGFGCSKCSGNKKYSTSEFVEKIKNIFGDKLKYNRVKYINQKTKVEIVCDTHGIIKKYPQSLMKGSGCNKCESINYKIDTQLFIERAKSIHGNKYEYKNISYINDRTNVDIICNKHGIFSQSPNAHLSGHGCIICSGRYKYSNIEFIERSNSIHKNKYNYNLVDYNNSHTKVKIICDRHGIFEQKPNCHLSGQGCPSCKESKGELLISIILTYNGISHERQKTFNGCRHKSLLFFDFYIENRNLCIEYDGEFHFKPIFGDKYFTDTITRDEIKTKFCLENNINLLRIPYTEFSNIENIIKKLFNF